MTRIHVSVDGDARFFEGRRVACLRFQDAIDHAGAGDEIVLTPGVYREPVRIEGKRAIRIRSDGSATLDGGRNVLRPPGHPRREHFAFIKILDCCGIEIADATIQNAWPTAIYIENSQDIAIRGMDLNGATYGIYARGTQTRGIVVEHCTWIQNHDIWDRVPWKDIHDPPTPRRELDGDFFRSIDIRGDVVVRHNFISQAFNGVHLFASEDAHEDEINRNVWIYRNTFAFIRDSAVEAEYVAKNWFVFENVIYNCHSWFAFELCRGGFWYIFSNRGWFDRRPGPPGDCNAGGGVIKTNKVKDPDIDRFLPRHGTYMFNNSFYLRSSYMKKGKLRNLRHFNNAIEYADADLHPKDLVDPGQRMIGVGPPSPRCDGVRARGESFTTDWTKLEIRFENDVCNHPDYPAGLVAKGYPVEGKAAAPGFEAGREGDFGLVAGSPCQGAGIAPALSLVDGGTWQLPAGLNIGAMDRLTDPRGDPLPYPALALGCPPASLPPDYVDAPSARPWKSLDDAQV